LMFSFMADGIRRKSFFGRFGALRRPDAAARRPYQRTG